LELSRPSHDDIEAEVIADCHLVDESTKV